MPDGRQPHQVIAAVVGVLAPDGWSSQRGPGSRTSRTDNVPVFNIAPAREVPAVRREATVGEPDHMRASYCTGAGDASIGDRKTSRMTEGQLTPIPFLENGMHWPGGPRSSRCSADAGR